VINIEENLVGCLYIMDMNNARKMDHTKIMSLMFRMHNAADTSWQSILLCITLRSRSLPH